MTRSDVEKMIEAANTQSAILSDDMKFAVNLHGADLSGADLSELDLSNANLHGVLAAGTNFENCDLTGANGHGGTFRKARFTGVAKLDGINLCQSCICEATFSTKASVRRANLSDCCCEDIDGLDVKLLDAKSLKTINPKGPVFAKGKKYWLPGDALEGSNLTGMSDKHED